jgi:hypothetical protein
VFPRCDAGVDGAAPMNNAAEANAPANSQAAHFGCNCTSVIETSSGDR